MSILEEVVETQPVDLNNYIEERNLAPLNPPFSSVRNRAAATALLSEEPEKILSNYQDMLLEADQGGDQLQSFIMERERENSKQANMGALISILSDPSVPEDVKREALVSLNDNPLLKETNFILAGKSISEGEVYQNQEAEDVRVIGAASQLKSTFEYQNLKQGLMNQREVLRDEVSAGKVADFLAFLAPFSVNLNSENLLRKMAETINIEKGSASAFIAPGSLAKEINEALTNTPPSERIKVLEPLLEALDSNSGIIFGSDNQFNQWITAKTILQEGGYSTLDKWLDNASGILDVIGLGFLAKPARVAKEVNTVTHVVNPASPFEVISNVNNEKARKMHELIVSTEGSSEALTGVSKTQAVSNNIMPQPSVSDGSVASKVPDVERSLRKTITPSEELVDAVYGTGALHIPIAEQRAAVANIVHDFQNASGLTINDAMTQVGHNGSTFNIKAVYGTTEGGFLRAEEAFEQAKLALRNYGIKDNEIEILQKVDTDYVPVTLDSVKGMDGDFLVRIDYTDRINPNDLKNLSDMESFSVVGNFLDRVPILTTDTQGSMQRILVDAASMLDPRITGAASVAVDRSVKIDKILLKEFESFAASYESLDKVRRQKMFDYIKEANFNRIDFSEADLIGRGFTKGEIDTVRSWRKAWDSHFWLENSDLVRTLNVNGFKLFENSNARLFAKPIPKNQNITSVYDPSVDKVVTITKQEMDDIYDKGGSLAVLRRQSSFGGDTTEHMIVRNTPTENLRRLRDTDQALNYTNGYYGIKYDPTSKFVIEKVKDSSGKIVNKTVAVAKSSAEAERFIQRQIRISGKSRDDFDFRGDKNALRLDSDTYWDLNSVQGRVAQRHRGKTLEDADGSIHISEGVNVLDPVTSAVRAAKSISGRVAIRDFIETSKIRFIQQYDKALKPNEKGLKEWPKSVKDIGEEGKATSKLSADARTTFEYINYIENGYLNSVDELYKQGSHVIADILGKYGFEKLERAALKTGEIAPLGLMRSTAFHAYLGTHPLRQLIIQPHQVLRMSAYNPTYMMNPKGFLEDALSFLGVKSGAKKLSSQRQKDVFDFIEGSGMLDAVDRHSLVKGALTDMAESSNAVVKGIGKTLAVPRKYGFDIGEQANLLGHLLAVRDKYIKKGLDIKNLTVRDQAYAEARALSYGMNSADDMPYNANSLGVIFQFMQVPHKAVLQYTNRRMSKADRIKMGIFDTVLWGTPIYIGAQILGEDVLPEDKFMREAISWNLESALMNKAFSLATGEDVDLDLSSLSPFGMHGWAEVVSTLINEGPAQAVLNSPSGKLFFHPDQSRVKAALSAISRFVGFKEGAEKTPEEFLHTLNEVAKISSGWNSGTKALAMSEYLKKLDKMGLVVKENVTNFEIISQIFGFSFKDRSAMYKASEEMRANMKEYEDSVRDVVKDIMGYYSTRYNEPVESIEGYRRVVNELMRIYSNDPVGQRIAGDELQKRMRGPDKWFVSLVLKYADIPDPSRFKDIVRSSGASEEDQKAMLEIHEDIQNYKEEN